MKNPFTWPGFARCLSVSFVLTLPVVCVVLHQHVYDARAERTQQAVRINQLERHLQSEALKNASDTLQQTRPQYDLRYWCGTPGPDWKPDTRWKQHQKGKRRCKPKRQHSR